MRNTKTILLFLVQAAIERCIFLALKRLKGSIYLERKLVKRKWRTKKAWFLKTNIIEVLTH